MMADRILLTAWFPGLVAAGWAYAPYVSTGPVFCLWRGLSGTPCWGCGLTRAFCSLVHGDVAAAIDFNVLIFPVVVSLAAFYLSNLPVEGGSTAWQTSAPRN
jgi:hypothetical protein